MNKLLLALLAGIGLMANLAHGETVVYQVDGKDYEGYYTSAAAEAPLVLLLHDWDGLTDYEIQRAQMLAAEGYSVFAADLFGKGVRPTKVEDKKQHTGALYKDRDKLRRLINGALDTARTRGANVRNAVAMGYCFGGAAVLELARSGADMKGFVTFHGGLGTPQGQDYSNTKGSALIFHGSADSMISLQDFASLGERLERNNIPHELISYGGAPHAFTVFDSESYRERADKLSWQRFLQYLDHTLGHAR
ncbi:MAG: dienelactone hydrolase [Pseudomonadales bacterium]|nr:dienelactone hydrolase [Pseudomonadales bacterium]